MRISSSHFPERSFLESQKVKEHSRIILSSGQTATRLPPRSILNPSKSPIAQLIEKPTSFSVPAQSVDVINSGTIFAQRMISSNEEILCDFPLSESLIDDYIAGRYDINPRDSGLYRIETDIRSRALENFQLETHGKPLGLVTSSEPINYGAWLIRTLPKYAALRDLSNNPPYDLICFAERPWQKRILGFLGFPEGNFINQSFATCYSSPTIFAPTWPNREKFLDTRTLGLMAELRAKARAERGNASYPKAIYVSRRQHSSSTAATSLVRPFKQEAQLEEALRDIGIATIYPESMDFAEVVAVFANAKLVIGPQGAGMFNCVFCEPGTKIFDIEHLPNFIRGHCNLFSSCLLDYFIICGSAGTGAEEHPIHKSLTIDIKEVVNFVGDFAKSEISF